MASELFFDQLLQRVVLASQLRVHLLVLGELRFQLLQSLQLRRAHAAVPRFPVVERRVADAMTSADLLDRLASFGLLQDRYDLRLGESASSHRRLLAGLSCQKTPTSDCVTSGEAYV